MGAHPPGDPRGLIRIARVAGILDHGGISGQGRGIAGADRPRGAVRRTDAPRDSADGGGREWPRRLGRPAPSSYSLTVYTAVTVIADAIGQVVRSGRPVTRATVRQTVAATRLPSSLQGNVSFDANGDLEHPVVSIYQLRSGARQYVQTMTVEGAPRDPGLPAMP